MIKNMKLKNLLTNTVFRALSVINGVIPKDESIVMLYSNMGFRDNVAYLYNYMVENGYNKRYTIVRSQNDEFSGELPENVKVISNVKGVITYLKAGHVFYAFGKLPIKPSKNQKVVQMWHGSPFKGGDVREKNESSHSKNDLYYTNVLSASPLFNKRWMEEFHCDEKTISVCGHARTDVMINPYSSEELMLDDNKMIIWMPTFRKSKKLGYNDVENSDGLVPVLKNDEFNKLNEKLREKKVKLVIKLHPVQDVDDFETVDFSNIELLTHDIFMSKGFDLYRLIGSADALITDYSSVFYDFMLMDRPIAFTEDDMDDYKDSRGFSVDDPDYFRAGHKIKTYDELMSFVEDVASENDIWKERRNEVNEKSNYYRDFNNSRRALEIGGVNL